MIPEYIIMIGSIAALVYLAYALHQRTNESVSNRDDWQDLNKMMSGLYDDNDSLRSDLQRAAKQVALLQSVNGNLKNTIEDLSLHKSELIDEMHKLHRVIDGFQQEIAYITSPPDPQPEPTADELDEWYESQAEPEDRSHIPPSTDLFNAITSAFTPIPPSDDDNE